MRENCIRKGAFGEKCRAFVKPSSLLPLLKGERFRSPFPKGDYAGKEKLQIIDLEFLVVSRPWDRLQFRIQLLLLRRRSRELRLRVHR